MGFVRNSLQEALFNLYGDSVKSSALGSINGSVGDNIALSGFTTSIINGKKILAIERWYNDGWTPSSMGTNLIVGFTGTGLTTENAPVLKYNNVLYPALEVASPANWGGVMIEPDGFQIVRYSNLGLAIHTEAFPGAADIAPIPVSSITFTKTLSFHDPNIITQLPGGNIWNTNPSPQILSNINIIGSGLVQKWWNRSKVYNSGTLIIEGELRLYNSALFTNTGYIIIKPGGKIRLHNGDEISSENRYLGFVMDGKVNNSDPRGIILVEGTGKIYLYNQRHITLYGNSNLITTTTDSPFNLESSTNNIIYRGDGTPTPTAYSHSTWLSTFIP